jgi:two-component system chemotaxis response regulator CheY
VHEVSVSAVLVVDDSKVMRDMVAACLKVNPALVVSQASSGLEAIEKLSLQQFDALVLDLNMPDIGGIEVVEFVRSQDRLRALPIVIVTTRGDETSRTNVMRAGATRYVTKPFTPDAILHEVNAVIGAVQPDAV